MQRMDTIFAAKPSVTDSNADMSITSIDPVDISVTGLTFSYPGTDVEVLNNISFELEAGGVLAVMGATGSGKSTLLSLLMRIWNPQEGTIKISGHEPESIPLNVLRSAISYVPQDTFLFSDTVMNNIKFYDERITDEDAVNAAKAAAVHSNIIELEKQYDTVVGERGMTLSGGQKQRISIARALSRKPSLLLLDDCLSAVDAETEQQILKNLREYVKNCTTIIVTHRIAAASLADRVLLLNEDGSQAALGTHEELVKTSPEYNRLLEIIAAGEKRLKKAD
jgi:ATP-binding cassette subfamily B protein